LCSSKIYPYFTHWRDLNSLGVRGSVTPKKLKNCAELNRNFQRERYGYFLELHNGNWTMGKEALYA